MDHRQTKNDRAMGRWVSRLLAGVAIGLLLPPLPSTFGNELWVPPAKKDQDKTVGNWAVANLGGETHFSFRVPDDLQSLSEAAGPRRIVSDLPNAILSERASWRGPRIGCGRAYGSGERGGPG